MQPYQPFDAFSEDLMRGVHQLHAAGHTVKAYFTNSEPDSKAHKVAADLPEIGGGNGYLTGGFDIHNDVVRVGGESSLKGIDVVVRAKGGPIGPFRAVVLKNASVAGEPLLGAWPLGEEVTLEDGAAPFTLEFAPAVLTIGWNP